MDARNESNYRPAFNANYLQTFDWTLSRVAISIESPASNGQEQLEPLPLHFPGVSVKPRTQNSFRGMTSHFTWIPQRCLILFFSPVSVSR